VCVCVRARVRACVRGGAWTYSIFTYIEGCSMPCGELDGLTDGAPGVPPCVYYSTNPQSRRSLL
jgi:hypothetical protein